MIKTTDPFYKSTRWQEKREKILRRDNYMCQVSWRYGKTREADTVHHIFPRDAYPQYEWEDWNLISLCAEMHDRMHDRVTGGLSNEGKALMAATAKKRGIDINEKKNNLTLVTGAPGSGKTTYVQHHLGSGICYDLDHIAAAFRLTTAHEEYHGAARRMANDLLWGWIENAHEYSDRVFVIRTRPTREELDIIAPSKIVACTGHYDISGRSDYVCDVSDQLDIDALRQYCDGHGIPLQIVERSDG